MSVVIRRKSDGKYAKGRTFYTHTWVEDLQDARTYPNRGNAKNSIKQLTDWRKRDQIATDIEIVEVRLVEVSDE